MTRSLAKGPAVSEPEFRRRLPRPIDTTVSEVVRESPDAVTLVLDAAGEARDYKAGQFVNVDPAQFPALDPLRAFLQHTKGRKEHPRGYSLASAPHEPRLAITLKLEPYEPSRDRFPPLLSPYLLHCVRQGDPLRLLGFLGPYVLPEDASETATDVLHVVAGSGAVPNFSILKDALHRGLPLRHTFVCGNKTAGDILFRAPLENLERAHPDRLRVLHLLTREREDFPSDRRHRRGRVAREVLREVLGDPERTLAFVCGPAITQWERRASLEKGVQAEPRFLESVIGALQELGVPNKRIKRESYG